MLIKQPSNLTYREVDGLYYITNIVRHEVVVLNESAFKILQLSNQRTIEEVLDLTSDNEQNMKFNRDETLMFLESLRSAGLIDY